MFKDRPTARRVMLVAGVGSTMPMRMADINRGWNSETIIEDIEPVNLIFNSPYIDKLTLGPVYVETKDKA